MIDIHYKDDHLLIVNKPHELLSVRGKTEPKNLYDLLKEEFPEVLNVHRLDMSTSGLMVFARNKPTQAKLGKLFEKREIKKRYSAVVHGLVEPDLGEIAVPLICDWPNRPKQHICWQHGKYAHTFFTVKYRSHEGNYTQLNLHPSTGRSHQLRVHCLALGHPILGDRLYATDEALNATNRLMLHAEEIEFTHPNDGKKLKITLDAPFAEHLTATT